MIAHQIVQRLEQISRGRDPVTQCAAADDNSVTGQDVLLAIEWKVIAVLREHRMRQQARPRQAFRNGLRRLRGDGHVFFADIARVLPAMMLNHFQGRRDKLQLFADFAADLFAKFPAARTRALFVGEFVSDGFARQMIGQRPATVTLLALLLSRSSSFVAIGVRTDVIVGTIVR